MLLPPFPLVILGGRDRRGSVLPEAGHDKHALTGFKAVAAKIGERTLIEILIERLRRAKAFDPIYVAGPLAVYGDLGLGASIIDTDGGFGDNLRASIDAVTAESMPPYVGFTTADILPTAADLHTALEDLAAHLPLDFWMPQCRVPDDPELLGTSAWKPTYAVRPELGDEPVTTLPGHLVVVDPSAPRLEIASRILDHAYRTRNRPIGERRSVMLRRVFSTLLAEDLRRLVRFRPPLVTWEATVNGLAIATELKSHDAGQRELEDRLRKLFVRRAHRKRYPERRGRIPILDVLSLARDIDTEEEAAELTGSFRRDELEL